ncbi:unnamed protein product, partial [marine sediment metagenome]
EIIISTIAFISALKVVRVLMINARTQLMESPNKRSLRVRPVASSSRSYLWTAYRIVDVIEGYVRVPESTDGTKEILQALAPKLECKLRWIGCSDYYKHEIDKKVFMLKFWRPGEWKYVLSDDELPGGEIAAAFSKVRNEETALVGYIPLVTAVFRESKFRLTSPVLKPRFFRWQPGLHWKKKHDSFYNAEGVFRDKWPRIVLKEMYLLHLKYFRPPNRLKAQNAYEGLGL